MKKITLPGWNGSDELHWQSQWEEEFTDYVRFQPGSWENPELEDWISALDMAIAQSSEPPVLVAHSLACLMIVEYMARRESKIAGAFLVGMPDPDGPIFPVEEAGSFRSVPMVKLNRPAVIVASTNDPYDQNGFAERCSRAWGADLVNIGEKEHVSYNVGFWLEGQNLLTAFCAGLTHSSVDSS